MRGPLDDSLSRNFVYLMGSELFFVECALSDAGGVNRLPKGSFQRFHMMDVVKKV